MVATKRKIQINKQQTTHTVVENIKPPPVSLAWRRHKKVMDFISRFCNHYLKIKMLLYFQIT